MSPNRLGLKVDLQQQFSILEHSLSIEAGQGLIYIKGRCPSLSIASQLRKAIKQIPLCRGIVDIIAIQPEFLLSFE